MTFQTPLALLAFLPIVAVIMLKKKRSAPVITFPGIDTFPSLPKSFRQRLSLLPDILQLAALIIIVVALARPQLVKMDTTVISRGVDIVIALDLSTSMLAVDRGTVDRSRTRLVIAREVIRNFVKHRPGDRIGFVTFAARPYPVAPLTLDHDWLATALDQLEIGTLEDGTALGDAILASINRLRSSPKQSRTIVLMTDGRSNAGETTPGTAAAVARTLGIKIHTIGIGGQTPALFPVTNPLGGVIWREVRADLDVDVLQEIATTTGGTFFRASNGAAMQSVYREIDRLARRPIEERQHRSVQELFPFLVATALLLSMASLVLRSTWLRGLF